MEWANLFTPIQSGHVKCCHAFVFTVNDLVNICVNVQIIAYHTKEYVVVTKVQFSFLYVTQLCPVSSVLSVGPYFIS